MPIWLKHALREIRSGLKGLGVFSACLIIGVASIAISRSINQSIKQGLDANAKFVLGGDVSVRVSNSLKQDEVFEFVAKNGQTSIKAETRSMVRRTDGGKMQLVELKAVDDFYPLIGEVKLSPDINIHEALDSNGFVAEKSLFLKLGIEIGDFINLGNIQIKAMAYIESEPDRVQSFITIGPRVIISNKTLDNSGIIAPGALVERTMMLDIKNNLLPQEFKQKLEEAFPDTSLRIRTIDNASPRVERFFDNMSMYLTLSGLASLLVGGIGISGAIKGWIDGKIATVAIFKCVGASSNHIFLTYFAQAFILAIISIFIGLGLSVLFLEPALKIVGTYLPNLELIAGLQVLSLIEAAVFGFSVAFVFSVWPLAATAKISPAALFRKLILPENIIPSLPYIIMVIFGSIFLSFFAIYTSERPTFAFGFIISSLLAFAVFWLAARGIMKISRRIIIKGEKGSKFLQNRAGLRIALANICRSGAPTAGIVLSIGLGLTVLVTIIQVQANIDWNIKSGIPEQAPSFFFIDIQSNQKDIFVEQLKNQKNANLIALAPMIRGRVTHINNIPVAKINVAQDVEWAVRGDRGLSASDTKPEGAIITKGAWWQENYEGEPLVSVVKSVAEGLGVDVGSTITFNVLGKQIIARVASLRDVNWKTLAMNFAFMLNEKALLGLPHSYISTVGVSTKDNIVYIENEIEKAVVDSLPNVSSIRIRNVLESVNDLIRASGKAIGLTAIVSLASGIMVLAGAIAAGHKRRVFDAVVLKVVGAKRIDVLRIFLIEYGIMGFVASVFAVLFGAGATYAVVEKIMTLEWVFFPISAIVTVAISTFVTLFAGFIGTYKALSEKAAPLLRNE